MQDTRTDPVAVKAPTDAETLAYLADALEEQSRMAKSIKRPVLAYLIDMAAMEAGIGASALGAALKRPRCNA